ncbi:MAG: sulfite exporter TauE/SafE family protein [Cytophagales bacterium]|nr:sulfite exporter TauE/SafE family protein [Cytophagales bacterium]
MLIAVSMVIGVVNTLAGSGSLVMLPLLMSFGLSPHLANGTNRVAIFFQSLVGSLSYIKGGDLTLNKISWPLAASLPGALLGAYAASKVDADFLEQFIGLLMILMLPLYPVQAQPLAPRRTYHP